MPPRKPCTRCNTEPKRAGNAFNCEECWLIAQPMPVQQAYAARRLAMVPPQLRVKRVPPEQWPEGRRWCAGCQTFVRLADCTGSRCKTCVATSSRAARLENEYSITQAQYDALFKAQDGRCYLCRRRSIRVPLAVDHDHKTGEVRGLLCPDPNYGCNLKIVARIDADPDPLAFIERLRRYYTEPPARSVLG